MTHTLKFDLTHADGQTVIEAFPTLAAYPEFAEADDKLMRYVIYGFDKGSALMKHKEPVKRREEALLLAGFKRDKQGNWVDDRCEAILANKDEEVNRMILRWLRSIMQSREFAFWLSGSEMVWQNIEKIAIRIEDDEDDSTGPLDIAEAKKLMAKGEEKEKDVQAAYTTRNNIFKVLPDQMETIKKFEAEIFPDTETKEMVTDLVNQINAGAVERRIFGKKND